MGNVPLSMLHERGGGALSGENLRWGCAASPETMVDMRPSSA